MNEVVSLRLFARFIHEFLYVDLVSDVQTKGDIVADSSRKEYRLLLNYGDHLVVLARIQLSNVSSVKQNLALLRIIEPFYEGND